MDIAELWIPVHVFLEEMESRGYRRISQEGGGFVIESPDSSKRIIVNLRSAELNSIMLSQMLRGLDVGSSAFDEIVKGLVRRTRDLGSDDRPHILDSEEVLRILKTRPANPARRTPENQKAAKKILERIKAKEFTGDEPSDISENLDRYIYE